MGAEATGALRDKDARHTGTARLETDELIFRGDDGYRLKLPLASLRNVTASDGAVMLDAPSGSFALELGDKAERWAEKIRSPKGLLDKLDLRPTYRVAIVGSRDPAFVKDLGVRVSSVTVGRVPKDTNVLFLWADTSASLKKLSTAARTIARDGAIWVIHPKGRESKVKDTDVFAAAKKVDLTATKVARFSETHTAEKLVIPVAKR